ncbi:3-keto-steroid reductase [Savitreella phatthalungensis]
MAFGALWDGLTRRFLSIQWLIALLVDLAPLYPRWVIFKLPHAISSYYVDTFNDPLAAGRSKPGGWYHSLVWLEIGIQVPLSLWIARQYRRGRQYDTKTLAGLLFYGAQVATATYACIYEMLSFDAATLRAQEKLILFSFFVPYVILPLGFVFTAVLRLCANTHKANQQAAVLAYIGRQKVDSLTYVVTGANSGIGFAIVEQLIDQSELALQMRVVRLQLILTVRDQKKAQATRVRLQSRLERYDIEITFVILDLCSMASVSAAVKDIKSHVSSIDAIILNAGMAEFEQLSVSIAIKQVLTRGVVHAITYPEYKVQRLGSKTADGMTRIFQANFFGHYIMASLLEDISKAAIWMSSLEAYKENFDPQDCQALSHRNGYESSKRLTDIMFFDQRARSNGRRLHLVHPGYCSTNIVSAVLPRPLLYLWELTFDFMYICGHRFHTATAYNGAYCPARVALNVDVLSQDVKWGSTVSRLGVSGIGVTDFPTVDLNEPATKQVVREVNALRQEWLNRL